MPDQPDLPALSDDLTAVADKQIKVATEARIAAFAARDQTIGALAKSEDDRSTAYRAVFEREQKADRLKSACPGLVLVHWLWPWC